MKRIFLLISLLLFAFHPLNAQSNEVIKLSKQEAEALFLSNNIELITSRLAIDQAEAQVIQAKLWPNPTLSISEVNLWSNGGHEELPPLFGKWGNATQISAEIEQVIQTAGKRKKAIALQKLEVEDQQLKFTEVLKTLKLDLRTTLNEMVFNQAIQQLYKQQLASTQQLTKAYQNQLKQGNINQAEYIRLKAAEMEFKKELHEIAQNLEEHSQTLKNLLMVTSPLRIEISDPFEATSFTLDSFAFENYLERAKTNHPRLLQSQNDLKIADQKYQLEKAQRTPDLTLSVNYDRGGNIMRDFIGVGLAIDLPVFDRNQGNIKEAQLQITSSQHQLKAQENEVANAIATAMNNYQRAREIINEIEPDYEHNLDQLLDAHFRNFGQRNLSMIQYLDFVEAYLSNKKIILEAKKELNEQFEALQFAVSQEL